jgi:hypothetical protein
MTALRVPARPDEGGVRLRPVPWRRMAGVTWRQHRFALAGVAVLLGGLAVYEWLTGESLHRAWAAAVACHPVGAPACQGPVNAFNYMENFVSLGGPLQLVPALIGAFTGAPVLAREMETGTFRFAWTQGFGRWRWALVKLSGLAVVLALAAGAFGMLVSWHYQPWFAPGNQAPGLTSLSPFYTGLFDLRGLAFPAWTLAAFAIGALAGMPGSAWILSQWSTKDGRFAFSALPARQPARPVLLCCSGREGRPRGGGIRPVPGPARLHAVDQLPAGQPVLGLPVDRGRLAARAVSAAHRRDDLAGPPPRRLMHRPTRHRRSPAATGALIVFPGGASGHCHASLYRQDGWYRKFRSTTRCPSRPPRSAPLPVSSAYRPPP